MALDSLEQEAGGEGLIINAVPTHRQGRKWHGARVECGSSPPTDKDANGMVQELSADHLCVDKPVQDQDLRQVQG